MKEYGLKERLNHAAIIGLVLTLFQVIIFLTGLVGNNYIGFIPQLIAGFLLFVFIKQARDKAFDGVISFGKAFGIGISLIFFGSLISAFYTYIHMKFINPNSVDDMLETVYKQYQDSGMSEDQIETAMEMVEPFTTPEIVAGISIGGYLFWGALGALVVAGIVKKDGNPFSNQTLD